MPSPPPPRAKQASLGLPQAQGEAQKPKLTQTPRVRTQRLYIALNDRWREEAVLGSEPFAGERKAADIALRDGDNDTLTRLGHAAAARIAWAKMLRQYAEQERGIAKRFFLETDPGIRAMYGLPPLDVQSYAAAHNLIVEIIRDRIDNELYAEYLEVRYMAAAYGWLEAGLWELWRDEGYTAADEMQIDLAGMPLEELFLLYRKVERRVKSENTTE